MTKAKSIAGSLRTATSIVFILHQNPDGDAIGSALALLRSFPDKKMSFSCVSPIADIFQEVLGKIESATNLPKSADLYVVVDCSDLQRTGFARDLTTLAKRKRVLVIDHHQPGDLANIATDYFLDRQASSTCEMIADIIDELRLPITDRIATPLLLGIHTDTGGFQHPNTSSKTLQLTAKLVRQGADYAKIRTVLSPRRELKKLRLWGEVLGTISINSIGIAVARVSKETLAKTDATASDLSGLAKYLCSVEGTKAALVMVEGENGWQGTLRTHSRTFNVGQLAKLLGGSGGKKVAGFLATDELISGTIVDEARNLTAVKKTKEK